MSTFSVDTTALQKGIDRMNKLSNSVGSMVQCCMQAKRSLDWDVMGEQQLEKKLTSLRIELEVIQKSIVRHADCLKSVINNYTESQTAAKKDIDCLESSVSLNIESYVPGESNNNFKPDNEEWKRDVFNSRSYATVQRCSSSVTDKDVVTYSEINGSHIPGDSNNNRIPDNEEWKQRASQYNKKIDEIDLNNSKYKATYMDVVKKDKNGNVMYDENGKEVKEKKIDATYCNIYAKDVMKNMGTPLPKYVDETTMELITDEQKKQLDSEYKNKERETLGYRYTNANCIARWLDKQGEDLGWSEVSPTEAQEMANKGHSTVAVWDSGSEKKSGHIAVVRPYDASEIKKSGVSEEGVYISQAGVTNHEYATVETGFGKNKVPSIKYYFYSGSEDGI